MVALACILATVTFQLVESDFWQHLLVGKAIWTTHSIPTRQLWSWPTWGAIDTTSSYSWAFRAMLWPVWSAGGLLGLYGWRWLTTALTFVVLWLTARTLGARGLSQYLVLVMAALLYRQRTQVRPETLAGLLFAFTLWLLERRRQRATDTRLALMATVWAWANVHVSYFFGPLLMALYALGDRRGTPARPSLWPALAGAVALCFVNPYGWRAVWQPFHFMSDLRAEPFFRTIGEMRPIDWHSNLANGFPVLLAGWAALQLGRWVSRRGDWIELALFGLFTWQALATNRFIGYWSIVAAPFVARDLGDWLAGWRRAPPPWVRSAGVATACVLILPAELARPDLPPGIGIAANSYPRGACDFIAAHDLHGRVFNNFESGGYLLWRFWPDRSRLPFMDIHQSGTADERRAYLFAETRPEGWQAVERRYDPEIVMWHRLHARGDALLDYLDADSALVLVFADDAAALYVRRAGPTAAVAARYGYSILPGGTARLARLPALIADPAARQMLRDELDRAIAASPVNSTASSMRATLNLMERRYSEAGRDVEHAHAVDPLVPRYWERLGDVALATGDARRAVECYRRQQRVDYVPELEIRIGGAWRALGRKDHAAEAYRASIRHGAYADAARDSLRSLGAAP